MPLIKSLRRIIFPEVNPLFSSKGENNSFLKINSKFLIEKGVLSFGISSS